MLTYRDLISGFKDLGLSPSTPLLVHASLSSFGEVRGGADALLGALMATSDHLMMPAFTCRTMIIPEVGPERNGMTYGSGDQSNRMAEFFWPDLPVDRMIGALAEKLRQHPHASRSSHPILSFSGINVGEALASQTLENPLAPIGKLAQQGGWALLIGVDHTANTAIHLAERTAGRRTFVRWSLTPVGIIACDGFPGCSDGFNQADPLLEPITRKVKIGSSRVRALPLASLLETITEFIKIKPHALLCNRPGCERCDSVRSDER